MAEHAELGSEYLSERPQKPLPSDCCDTGCSPCVMDLYHEELAVWERLRAMSVQDRQQWVEDQHRVRVSRQHLCPQWLSPAVGIHEQFESFNIKLTRQTDWQANTIVIEHHDFCLHRAESRKPSITKAVV